MKKVTMAIKGMHCASCAANIQHSLSKIAGLKNAQVNVIMKKGTADVEDSVTETELKKAVQRAGYEATSVAFV
jgi:Cu+-exporting ATPase